MANSLLATYLNDHLAGSEVAIELLRHLEKWHKGTPIAAFAGDLLVEIEEDRIELEALMSHLKITRSLPRKAVAWVTEKMTDLKLWLDDLGDGRLHLLETLEGLSLGIEGKRSLWMTLEAASDVELELRAVDYANLQRRAEEQRIGVEAMKLEAAKTAFGSPPVALKG